MTALREVKEDKGATGRRGRDKCYEPVLCEPLRPRRPSIPYRVLKSRPRVRTRQRLPCTVRRSSVAGPDPAGLAYRRSCRNPTNARELVRPGEIRHPNGKVLLLAAVRMSRMSQLIYVLVTARFGMPRS